MSKVNLAKLLKVKNRTSSETVRVKNRMTTYNTLTVPQDVVDTTKFAVDTHELMDELVSLTDKLVRIKSAISLANAKAADKIFRLSEIKGLIAYFEGLDCGSGRVSNRYSSVPSPEVKLSQISLSEKDELVKDLIKQSQDIQDELDTYNHNTTIEVDDDLLL